MKKLLKVIISGLLLIFGATGVSAQDITPVDIDTQKPEQPRLHYYDKHGNQLKEPVMFIAELDTITKPKPGSPWPVFNGMSVGLNIWDAAMLIAGQSYASFDASLSFSIRNWIFPTVECGVGFANNHSDQSMLIYKTKLSPFLKIGADYNFLYKSTPDYQLCLGVRFGVSPVSYEITDITLNSGYWKEDAQFSILKQHTTSFYGQALASVKVKIWKQLSLGWSVRYHFNLHTPDGSGSKPWFIPGYGTSSPVNATFSVFYTFGQKEKKKEEAEVLPEILPEAMPESLPEFQPESQLENQPEVLPDSVPESFTE